jgi:nitrogen fixation NifU-like protein
MYSKKVLKIFNNPKFSGEIKEPSGIGEVGNIRCGDILRIYIKVKNNRIIDIKYLTLGCVAAIVSSEVLCKLAKGKTISEALKITDKDIVKELGGKLPPIKYHCSVLGANGLRKAIEDYKRKVKK